MDIKSKIKNQNIKTTVLILLFFLIGANMIPNALSIQETNNLGATNDVDSTSLKTQGLGEGLIHDKVHTFHEDQREIILDPYLLGNYSYDISFAVVTDAHECHMNVSLTDPNGLIYYIWGSEVPMRFEAYYTVPYGVTVKGNHTLIFSETEGPNLNIHIKIRQGDEIPPPMLIPPNCSFYLKSDTMYKFYISRVSPIAYGLDNTLDINLNLTDPTGIVFNIFNQEPIVRINTPIKFPFGTAIEGLYVMDINAYYVQPNINIVIQKVEVKSISTELNSSDIGNETSNNNLTMKPFIPPAAFYGGVGVIGIFAIIALVIGYISKKKYNN